MTREEYERELKYVVNGECNGDCISRQAAIDLADELKDDLPDDDRLSDMVMSHNEGILEYQTKLSLLPPVQPKQRTGRWIESSDGIGRWWECSQCGSHGGEGMKYCMFCGAKMEVEDENTSTT